MRDKKVAIYECLKTIGLCFEFPPSVERLKIYTEHLQDYSVEQLTFAFKQVLKTERNFPAIATIYKIINPKIDEIDEANKMAGQIIDAIPMFGYTNANAAKEYLSEKAWYTIKLFGGWETLCKTETSNLGTIRAQLRDLCKSTINIEKIDDLKKLMKPERDKPDALPQPIGNLMKGN